MRAVTLPARARSSVDRALASGARGRRFKSCRAHCVRSVIRLTASQLADSFESVTFRTAVLGIGVAVAMCVAAAPAAAAPTCHTVQVHQRLVRHEWRRVHRRRPARGRSRGRSRRRSYTTVRIRVRVIRWRNYSVLRCGLPETGPLGSTQLVENGNLAATATVQDPAAGAERSSRRKRACGSLPCS